MGNIRKRGKQPKVKEPVRIRFRLLKDGSQSIFLDTWDGKLKRHNCEFLKHMYIIPERSPADKEHNRETLEYAKKIQAQRIVELQTGEYGLSNTGNRKQKMLLCDYVKHINEKMLERNGNDPTSSPLNYQTLRTHLLNYAPQATIKEASSKAFCSGFIEYLRKAKGRLTGNELCSNTQRLYVTVITSVFNQAIRDGIIKENPFRLFDRQELPRAVKPEMKYLSKEEVERIEAVETPHIEVKQAFLFSCYTGLRFSDIRRLTWEKIRQIDNETKIVYRQKKTQKQEYLPLAKPALAILNDRGRKSDNELVFALQGNEQVNKKLKSILMAAGLAGKGITFHTARHTAAMLILRASGRLDVVKEILGHSSIDTTLRYAKADAEQQKEAIRKLDDFLDKQ
jgi:integrase